MHLFEFGLLLLLGTLWGIPYALTKLSLETIPPITLTAARVSLAAVTLWGVAVILGRKFPQWSWELTGRLFIQASIACVIPYTLIAFGQYSVDSGLAAILNSSTPLFVCLLSVLWTHHEPITFGRISGAIIGLGGVVAIVGASVLLGLGRQSICQAAILLATFSSAVSVIHGRRFAELAPETVAAGMLTWAAIILVPVAVLVETPWRIAPSIASLTALGINGVVATAFGFVIYFRLIRTIGSMGTASASYLKPGIGVLIGCTLLGEPWTWSLGGGLLAILLGVIFINVRASIHFLSNTIRSAGERLKSRKPHIVITGSGVQPR
jgi:drug/metabolite transporter (DMT)-like permease